MRTHMNIYSNGTILSARNYCNWKNEAIPLWEFFISTIHLSPKVSSLIQATINLVLLRTADWSRNQKEQNSKKYTHTDKHTHAKLPLCQTWVPGWPLQRILRDWGSWSWWWLSAHNQTNPLVTSALGPSVAPVVLTLCWEFQDSQATSPQGQLHSHSSQAHPHIFGLGAASLQNSLPLLFGNSAHPWPHFTHPSSVTNGSYKIYLCLYSNKTIVIHPIEATYYRGTIHSLYINVIPTGCFLEKTWTASETNITTVYYRNFSHLGLGQAVND